MSSDHDEKQQSEASATCVASPPLNGLLEAMQKELARVEKWACCTEPERRVRAEYRVKELENTIKTFLHDLDDHNDEGNQQPVLMPTGMWLQVAAFRKLVEGH